MKINDEIYKYESESNNVFNFFKIKWYAPKISKMYEPEIPGKIIAHEQIKPQIKIYAKVISWLIEFNFNTCDIINADKTKISISEILIPLILFNNIKTLLIIRPKKNELTSLM